jgi:CRP/FNR family transcriptional regulator
MAYNNTIDTCARCTAAWKNYRHLSEQELKMVNENRFEASFRAGEVIVKQGSPASNALFLSKGLAKVYIEGPGGNNFILFIARPGRMIMGPGGFTGSRNTYSVSALTPVHACFVNFSILKHLARTNGKFAEGMLEDISAESLNDHRRLFNLTHKKMRGRLADTLLYLAGDIFSSDEFDMLLSRRELGEIASMAKESVVRIMKEFSIAGIISYRSSRVKIIDRQKLVSISEEG